MNRAFIVCLAAAGSTPSLVHAALINFGAYFPPAPSRTWITDDGWVTFTDPAGVFSVATPGTSFPSDRVLLAASYNLTVTFSVPVYDVTVGNLFTGLYTSEIDVITGVAYDSSNNPLGTVTNSNPAHTMPFTGITKIVYTAPTTGFTLSYLSFLPAPSVASVFGLAALHAARRRR